MIAQCNSLTFENAVRVWWVPAQLRVWSSAIIISYSHHHAASQSLIDHNIVIQRSWFLLQRKLCLEDPNSCLRAFTVYSWHICYQEIQSAIKKFKKFFKLDISAITSSVSCDSTMADQKLLGPAFSFKHDELVCSVIHIHSDFFFYYDFFICCSQFLKFRVFLIWCFGHKIIASWPDSRYLICNYGRLCCLRIRLKVYVCYQNRIYKFWTQR